MKTSIIASIIGAAVIVAAQGDVLSQLPSCATPCALSAIGGITGCNSGDYACYCKNDKFITDVYSCLQTSCKDPEDIKKATAAAQTLCAGNFPSAVVSSLQGAPTGKNATGGSSNGTRTTGSGSSPTGDGSSASSTAGSAGSDSGAAAGLVPGGFAVAAIFAGFLAL